MGVRIVSLKNRLLLAAAVCASLSAAVLGPASGSSNESELTARIARIENGLLPAVTIKGRPPPTMNLADRMKHHRVPGMSVAFFDRGQILWTRAYGLANVANNRPVTPETLFQAASISKPVSALAALHLVQDGKLRLDEDVNLRLRTWKLPENGFTKEQKVTLRRILSHSAGLTVHGFPGYASGEPLPTVVQILDGEKPAKTAPIRVDTVPGTLWRYSGGGYVILQMLLADVTGQPYPDILNRVVLRPAGMTHSTYQQPLPTALWPLAATAYHGDGLPVKRGWHIYPEMAPAGLWTTPSDLARLAIEVQNEYAGSSSKILSQQMMHQMLARQKDDWGLGFALEPLGHEPRFGHNGANEGYRCDLEAYRTGQGVAIMTNSDHGGAVASEFLRAIAKEYNWPDFQPVERVLVKIDPAQFTPDASVYEIPGMGNITVSIKDARLYVQAAPLGPEPQELFPDSETEFFILSMDLTFHFQRDDKGVVSTLVV